MKVELKVGVSLAWRAALSGNSLEEIWAAVQEDLALQNSCVTSCFELGKKKKEKGNQLFKSE